MTAEIFDASYLQESLFRSAKNGESAVNVGVVLRLRGPLDVPRLLTALRLLWSRHEALRTTLASVNGTVCQVIAASGEVPAVVLDLSAERDPEAEAIRLIKDHLRRPFVLQGPTLCRVIITTCAADVHFLAFSLHHSVMDGWSAGILTADLRACYRDTGAARLAAPAIQPADYAAWERQAADAASLEGWRERLRGYSTRSRIAGATDPGPEQLAITCELPDGGPDVSDGIQRLARQLRVPVVAVLTAAVAASLHDYVGDGTPGLTIGLVRANRERPELRDVVGYLADITPLTIDLRSDLEFSRLVGQAAEAVAYSHDHPVPLAALSGLLRTGDGKGPLFDVCLNYLPAGLAQEQDGGEPLLTNVDIKDEEPTVSRWWDGTALIDYVLRPAPTGRLAGCVRGDLNTFAPSLLADLAERLWMVLLHGTESPHLRVSDLAPALPEAAQ